MGNLMTPVHTTIFGGRKNILKKIKTSKSPCCCLNFLRSECSFGSTLREIIFFEKNLTPFLGGKRMKLLETTNGGFLKWWFSPTKPIGFPTKNDHFGVFWGYHHLRKHPNWYEAYFDLWLIWLLPGIWKKCAYEMIVSIEISRYSNQNCF